jgi:hypothetical protein
MFRNVPLGSFLQIGGFGRVALHQVAAGCTWLHSVARRATRPSAELGSFLKFTPPFASDW